MSVESLKVPRWLAPLAASTSAPWENTFVKSLKGGACAASVCGGRSFLERCGGSSSHADQGRWASEGKVKRGESAKEKKLRRLLNKLNAVEDKSKQLAGAAPHEAEEGGPTRQRGRGESGGGDNSRATVEAECKQIAVRAEQHMQQQLQHLESRLKGLQVARPQLETFERIQVHVGGSTRLLADVGQVVIRGSSVVRVTLFSGQHLAKVVSALRNTDESWAIVEEGPNTVRVQLPRMNAELRSSFISKAKTATEECKVQIRRVRQEARGKLHGLREKARGLDDSRKRENEQHLQKLTDDAVKRASGLLNAKLQELTNPPA
ncbi:hypothetical protein Esti_001679 [Eimeria stiedai]